MLTEVSKTGAPSLLLSDFNYFFNKAIALYINKLYNIYDVNQQTTDSLRVLKSTATLDAISVKESESDNEYNAIKQMDKTMLDSIFGATYEITLPDDYLHMLNCVCIYEMGSNYKCYNKGNFVPFSAKRLTGDAWSSIINDYYLRPTPERPYYYINNVNKLVDEPTNLYNPENHTGTDLTETSEFPTTLTLKDLKNTSTTVPLTNAVAPYIRHANASRVRCEVRYGYDNSVFLLRKVFIDYIKAPLRIRLTQELVNKTLDTSLVMEFPDYVCNEIINELVTLIMENSADPRLLTHIPVTQSIANPAQQLAPQTARLG